MARHLAAAALLLLACTRTETVTVPAADAAAPLVLLTSPGIGAAGVPLDARVGATFSETMDSASLAPAFSLTGPGGAVDGSAAANPDARAVTFTPAAPLDPDAEYTASISTAARDAAGNALSPAVTWTFRTAAARDLTPPNVVAVSPAAGSLAAAAETPSVSATFDEPIDCAGLPASALALYEASMPVPGYVDCSGATLEFVALPALPTRTSLLAVVSPLVRDVAGNALGAAKVWSFDVRPWTVQLGSAGDDYGYSVATDAAGNVFVAGYTTGGLDGSASAGSYDLFVVKHGPDGAKLWIRQLGSTGEDSAYSVATDAAGNAFVAGYTTGDLDGNASAGGTDLFVVKYGPDGAKLWTRQLGSAGDDYGYSVATDAAGNVFVAGYTTGDLDGNASTGLYDLFVVKYDPDGAKLWTRQLGSTGYESGYSVATDGAGNVFVSGETSGALDGNPSAGLYDLFVAKYDPDGARLWTRQLGSASYEYGNSVATDGAGNAFVTGQTAGNLDGNVSAGLYDLFAVKYGPDGAKLWTRQLGSAADDYGRSVATDAAGSVFVAGHTAGNLDGNAAAGLHDLFVVKYDPGGRRR